MEKPTGTVTPSTDLGKREGGMEGEQWTWLASSL